jgi:hypothetical protein
MSISEELYARLKQAIMPSVEVSHAHYLPNCLWIVSGTPPNRGSPSDGSESRSACQLINILVPFRLI